MKQFGNIPNLGGPTKIWIFDVFKPAFYDIEYPNLGGPTKIWEFGKLFHLFSNCLQLFSNCFNCFEIVSSCFQIVYYVPAHCFRPNTEHEGGVWGDVGWMGGGRGGAPDDTASGQRCTAGHVFGPCLVLIIIIIIITSIIMLSMHARSHALFKLVFVRIARTCILYIAHHGGR